MKNKKIFKKICQMASDRKGKLRRCELFLWLDRQPGYYIDRENNEIIRITHNEQIYEFYPNIHIRFICQWILIQIAKDFINNLDNYIHSIEIFQDLGNDMEQAIKNMMNDLSGLIKEIKKRK